MTDEYLNGLLKPFLKTENSQFYNIVYDDFNIDLSCLNDKDKFTLIVLLYNIYEYGCTKKKLKKIFPEWTNYKIGKLSKDTNVEIVTLFNDEGFFSGKGYMFKWLYVVRFRELWNEYIKNKA